MTHMIDGQGVPRMMGNIHAAPKRTWKVYGDTPDTPMILRKDWKPTSLKQWTSPIKDQMQEGACNAFDTVYVMEACRALEGLPYVKLSPGWLYGNINGQQDNGSALEDALAWMLTHGTVPASMVPEQAWQSHLWPAGCAPVALLYRMLEAFWCPTFAHMASASQSGLLVSDGIDWYDNFMAGTDGDGWLPAKGTGNAGGHALMRDGLAYRNGVWGLDGPNSWGPGWGAKGRMVMPESIHNGQVGGWWAIRGTVQSGGGIPIPKKV